MKRSLREEEPTAIDLSSMIDCIFILLIFFIVTTVFVEEKGMQVHKPDAAASAALEESENVVLEITAEDQILVNHVPVSLADVTSKVKASVRDAETPVLIRAHEKSKHGTLVAVWDAAKLGGAETLTFSTVN